MKPVAWFGVMADGNHNKGNSFDRKANFQNEIIYFGYNSLWISYNNIVIKICL